MHDYSTDACPTSDSNSSSSTDDTRCLAALPHQPRRNMAAPVVEQRPLHTHEILGRTNAWHFRDGRFDVRDFDRTCVHNAALSFRREGAELSFCVLISAGASHLATV